MYTGALQTIEILLEGAVTTNDLPWTAEALTTALAVGPANGVVNSATPVVIMPASSGFLKTLVLRNADTVDHTVTIQLNNNGVSQRKVIAFTLDVGACERQTFRRAECLLR
jgi:hypothetical protein